MYLDEVFYPQSMDMDQGVPDFGIGVQYADFGIFAIVYLAVFALLRGWLARVFVRRLLSRVTPLIFLLSHSWLRSLSFRSVVLAGCCRRH